MPDPTIPIPLDRVADFCRRWKIVELSLFGSVLRNDFGPGSDVDVLVSFASDATVTLWSLTEMAEELERMFGRKIDLVEKRGIVNPFVRHRVLTTRRKIYAA